MAKKTEKTITKRSKSTKEKTGRKRKEIDWGKLDAILQFRPPLKTASEILEVSHDTLERRIKEKYDMTFTEYRDLKMGRVVLKLQQKAITDALAGNNTMLIFCLKNICGWSDNPNKEEETKQNIQINISKEDLNL